MARRPSRAGEYFTARPPSSARCDSRSSRRPPSARGSSLKWVDQAPCCHRHTPRTIRCQDLRAPPCLRIAALREDLGHGPAAKSWVPAPPARAAPTHIDVSGVSVRISNPEKVPAGGMNHADFSPASNCADCRQPPLRTSTVEGTEAR